MGVPSVPDLLTALSQETRFELVCHLTGGKRCACDLEALLTLPKPKVSPHLGILRKADLVLAEQRGKNTAFTLRQDQFVRLRRHLLSELYAGLLASWPRTGPVC